MHEIQTGEVYNEGPLEIKDIQDTDSFDILKLVKIIFLPCDPIETFIKKVKRGKYDMIYLAGSLGHRLPDACIMIKDNGTMVVENAKYLLDFTEEQVKIYEDKVDLMATENQLKKVSQALPENCKILDYLLYSK